MPSWIDEHLLGGPVVWRPRRCSHPDCPRGCVSEDQRAEIATTYGRYMFEDAPIELRDPRYVQVVTDLLLTGRCNIPSNLDNGWKSMSPEDFYARVSVEYARRVRYPQLFERGPS